MPYQAHSQHSHFQHTPVMAKCVIESIDNLPKERRDGGLIIDATLGGGGHSALVLEAHPNMNVIGLDQDPTAIEAAKQRLMPFGSRVEIFEGNFAEFQPTTKASVVLADLGVSSPQLDVAARGFSFTKDGPLDMRMNQEKGIKASELIAKLNEKDLSDVIYSYGEEKFSRKIARRIKRDLLDKGPYSGTLSLAYAIAGCYPPKSRYGRIHPATRTFQALRIAVNNELEALDHFLEQAPDWLKPQGLIMLISFHSLEDRLVKRAFKDDERLERITRKPIIASEQEISNNPRSRSAKFRSARRKGN